MKPIKVICKKAQDLFIKDKTYLGQCDKKRNELVLTAEDGKEHTYKILMEKNIWFEEIK